VAIFSMMVQLSRVIYSNIYREDDRPECTYLYIAIGHSHTFMPANATSTTPTSLKKNPTNLPPLGPDRRGNRVLVALACMNICIYLIGKGYYIWRNKTREKKWNAMSPEVGCSSLKTPVRRQIWRKRADQGGMDRNGRIISLRRRIRGVRGWM
jgi:hypothetical protein